MGTSRKDFLKLSGLALAGAAFPLDLFSATTGLEYGQRHTPLLWNPQVDRSFISFRIGIKQSLPEKRYAALLDLFNTYKGVTDEITFFTSTTHAPLPLSTFKQRMDIFKDRMEQARKNGYKSGINILTTIGHHEENLDNSLQGNYTHLTDIDGQVSRGAFCPNDTRFQEYIRAIYTMTARANPDYIWIDDDVRLAGHMPVVQTCFCHNCLAVFETETGVKYTREQLKKAMNEGDINTKLKFRKTWLQHNRNTITRLFKLIETTVHDIHPGMPLGFMTGDRFYEGYDFENWATTLAGPGHSPVMWRPGGGYYQDNATAELVGKSHDIGRQVSVLPAQILAIPSEIENFPYQRLKKAAEMVVLETCSHIAAGCTGAAFNVLSFYDEPLDEYEPLVARLQQARPFFDLMTRSLGRAGISGIQTFWNKDSFIAGNPNSGNWFSGSTPIPRHEIYDIGLPAAYSGKSASVVILGMNSIYALSRKEIEAILSGGVYMDTETLQQLNEMNFGYLTGFEVINTATVDRIEKLNNHPLNGNFAGRERDNRQSFWKSAATTLKSTAKTAQPISGLIDYADKEVADCTMGVFENPLGGRICVAGYYPWIFMENLSKSSQMKSVFRWLSKDKLPGYIASFQKMNLWIREPENGKIAIAFNNASFDAAKDVELMLRTENEKIKVYDMACKETVIRASGTDGPYRKFLIPHVDAWQMRLVICG